MTDLFQKIFQKLGVRGAHELDNTPNPDGSPTELESFERMKAVLDKEELTIEDFKNFLEGQIGVIESRWRDLTIENSKKAELIPYHTTYKILLSAINAPRVERTRLEEHLNKIIS